MFETLKSRLLSWLGGPEPPHPQDLAQPSPHPEDQEDAVNGVELSASVREQLKKLGLPLSSLPPAVLAKAERKAFWDGKVFDDPHADPLSDPDDAMDYTEEEREFDDEEAAAAPGYVITGIRTIATVPIAQHPRGSWVEFVQLGARNQVSGVGCISSDP